MANAAAEAPSWPCRGRIDLKGDCAVVRGRMQPYNGGPPNIRIWPVGTHRLLGVEQTGDERINVPPDLEQWVEFGTLIYANFTVCPLAEDKPGQMRLVCVESADNIRVERYTTDKEEPDVIYPPPAMRRSNNALSSRPTCLSRRLQSNQRASH